MVNPYLIKFPQLGGSDIGYISVAERQQHVPFEIKRVFWTYYTPESILRGRHANHLTKQVLVAVAGRITVTTELADRTIQVFRLDKLQIGLYVPPHAWHTMQYLHTAVQLVFASTQYDEADYIRRYEEFQQIWQGR
jgi:hypothetical protein